VTEGEKEKVRREIRRTRDKKREDKDIFTIACCCGIGGNTETMQCLL
jgi:hypothetical protein